MKRPSYDFIADRRMGERRSLAQGGWRPSWGEAARRQATSLLASADRRMGERRSSTQVGYRPWGKLRDVKRPACCQRQTGACRRCGLAVSQLCRGHEEPVGAQDLSATGRRTPTDQVRTKHRARSVPGVQRQKRSTPTARLMSSGMKRSTPTRRTGVQRAKDQRQTPTAGLGPRTESYVKSVVSIRAACEGPTSNSASAAFPRGRPGRANHPPVVPVQQGSRTQVSMVGNLGESLTVQSLSTSRDPQKRACGAPFQNRRQIVHKT